MKKVLLWCFALPLFFASILPVNTIWASEAYVTDSHEIALRTGPSSQNRVKGMVAPSTAVEVTKTRHDWSQIRVSLSSGKVLEGWVQSKFLGTDSPERLQAMELESSNAALKEQNASLEKEKEDFTAREKELLDKIGKLEGDYESLRAGSTNYLDLKEEFDALKEAMTSVQKTNQTLIQENENLRLSQTVKWMVLGALLVFCGWLMGILSGRIKKRQRPSYRL